MKYFIRAELAGRLAEVKANDEKLTVLNLEGLKTFEVDVALEALMDNYTIRNVTLGEAANDSSIYKLIEILARNQNLLSIRINNNNSISDSGYQALAKALETNSKLIDLRLEHGTIAKKIGKKTIDAFIKMLKTNRSLTLFVLQLKIDSKLSNIQEELIQAVTSHPTLCHAQIGESFPQRKIASNPLRMDIFPALKSGDLMRVKKLIDAGLSVDSVAYTAYPKCGYSPLMLSVRANDIPAVKLLLQYDRTPLERAGDVDRQLKEGLNRLQMEEAGSSSQLNECVKTYIGYANPSPHLKAGEAESEFEALKRLRRIGDESSHGLNMRQSDLADMLIIYPEDSKLSALEMAQKRGFVEIEQLIKDACDKRRIKFSKKEIGREVKASPSVMEELKVSPAERTKTSLRYFSKKEQLERMVSTIDKDDIAEVKLLLTNGCAFDSDKTESSPILKAIEKHNIEILELLIQVGASINNKPALQLAAEKNHDDIIRLLAAAKANINMKHNGETALHVAVKKKHEKLIPLLIELKADVNAVDEKGMGALKHAVDQQQEDIVETLLRARGDANIEDRWGEISLMSDREHVGISQQLIEAKADLNWISKQGLTPVSKAACKGFQVTTQLLIESKANLSYVNKFDAAILPLVVESSTLNEESKLAIIKLLLAGKASILGKKSGKTASQIANEADYRRLIQYLQPLEQAVLAAPSGVVPIQVQKVKSMAMPDMKMSALKPEEFTINFSIKYSELIIEQPAIGEGAFGVVYKGQWQSNAVAIKKLNGLDFNESMVAEIQNEAKVMAQISTRSDYLVKLKGICLEKPHYCLVMEYLPNGNLYQYLHSDAEISWERRYGIGCGVAIGVMHLHSADVLHRDLKSLNVLLDSNFNSKLADFGLAKLKDGSSSAKSGIKGTPAWMAPELLDYKQDNNEPTAASDIYSLGMVLWELASRESPYAKKQPMQVLALIMGGVRAYKTLPADCPQAFKLLIESCCHEIPAKRPSAESIANHLNTLWQESRRKLPISAASASPVPDYLSESRSYGGSLRPLS